jgi:methyltransferase
MNFAWSHLDPIAIAVLAFVTAQRLAELSYSRFNEARLKSVGGVEHGASHYPWIVALHIAWLAGLWLAASGLRPHYGWLVAFVVLQGIRGWVLLTLGSRWTTRVIVLPDKPPIRSGPYRFLSHPNYAVVAAEIFVLPMAFGLFAYALFFSVANAAMLVVRIRAENAALRNPRTVLDGMG